MKTLFIGQKSIHLESTDSTNTYASEMLRQDVLTEGTVIYSFKQTNGRGQRGSSWLSEPGKNIAFSVVLRPKFLRAEQQFFLSKITSLAVTDLMAELLRESDENPKIHIKWPNDVYVNGKKVAGILIENALKETIIANSIVGIGINVNQKGFDTLPNASSLAKISHKEFDLMQVIERLCHYLEAYYLQLKSNKLEHIENAYLKRLYKMGEWANYCTGQTIFEGKIKGVTQIGKLQVELKTGELKEFDLKEIAFES